MILKIIKKMSVTGMRMIIKLCKFISNKKSVVKINVKLNTNVKYLLVKHDGRHQFFTCISRVRVVHVYQLHVFNSLLRCPLRFPRKNDVRFVVTSICFVGRSFFLIINVPFQIIFIPFNSNTTGVISGAGIANHFGASEFLMGFVLLDLLFSVQCFVDCCLSVFFWPL